MPKGRYPRQYFADPRVHEEKSIEEIYADLDAYTFEYFEDEPEFHDRLEIYVVLPPLLYEGQMTKGILWSMGVDHLHKLYPQLGQLFFTVATSQWASMPWSRMADGYFSLYENPERDAWFRQTYPERANKVLLPLQCADHTNEYVMAPAPFDKRDFDVVCVSRMHLVKNLPMVAEALKVYRRKYRPIRMVLIPGKDFDRNLHGLTDIERQEWRKVETILEHPHDYIELVPKASYGKELPAYYSRSKLCVLGALLEGKNRALYEAISCNTPFVCFRQFNQYARGEALAFPEGAGVYAAEFDAESLADAFHEVLENHGDFRPRRCFLEQSGRKNFLNRCVDAFSSYYEKALPDHVPGDHVTNLWLDLAVQYNYQLSLFDFIYDKNFQLTRVRGLKAIDTMLEFYFQRFGIRK